MDSQPFEVGRNRWIWEDKFRRDFIYIKKEWREVEFYFSKANRTTRHGNKISTIEDQMDNR